MKGQRLITNIQLFNAKAIVKNTAVESMKIDMRSIAERGACSLQYAVTGSGTARFEYLISNEDTPTNMIEVATDIATGITVGSGPGTDGKDIAAFTPTVSRWLQIQVTETGNVADIAVTAWLVVT